MGLFYQGNDPLLTQRTTTQIYNPDDMYYAQLFRQSSERDWIGELDDKIKTLTPELLSSLGNNRDFAKLNQEVQDAVQKEIMTLVKYRLNMNEEIITKIKKQLEIIEDFSVQQRDEERRNLAELNDYMKNYSHLTYDDYRRLKNEGGRGKAKDSSLGREDS